MADIDLLLSHFDTQDPVLGSGLPLEAAAAGPRPAERADPEDYRYEGGDQDSLPDQRWGIVIPDGEVGERLLSLVTPLRKLREEQQGAPATVYRVPKDMGPDESAKWWGEVYQDEDVPVGDRPKYLLLLGDADLVSWDLQHRLAADLFTGRLAFSTDEAYEAYAAKVLAAERAPAVDAARALFYTVRDGTPATTGGYSALVRPTLETARAERENGRFEAKEIVELGDGESLDLDEFMAAVSDRQPGMLFTMSHGLGAPRGKGWGSAEEQRRFQGAMSLGRGERLTHEVVANRPFLPGGVWFYFACFGAGTPSASAYLLWLEQLKEIGRFRGSLAGVVESLPKEGQKPFVAALPQAALANPDGPLAVMGHVDLAWSYSFQDYREKSTRDRPSRFHDVFRALVEGKRVGHGFHDIHNVFNQASTDLTTIYGQEERARRKGLPPEDEQTAKSKAMKKANLWMLHQDLAAYVLLGDPAARLQIERAPAQAEIRAAAISAPARQKAMPREVAPGFDVDRIEEAVLAMLGGDEAPNAIAKRFGVERAEIERWVKVYREAGRAAVGRIG
jgi:hypothetical protein